MENNNNSTSQKLYSYLTNPDIKFETYEPGEKIILLLRAHPFTQLFWIIYSLFFFVLLLIINVLTSGFFSLSQNFMINCFGLVFIAGYMWFCLLNWYFNVGIVTTKRIIDIDFSSVLYKEVTVARLDKIEDITVKSGGYFEAFFDYGTIEVQTAATKVSNVVFDNVPMPSEVVKTINKIMSKRHGV